MNKQTIILFISLQIIFGIFSACNDFDDDYSTNPNHQLSFSVDTVSFDTVFTTISSATRQLMIYNKNKEPLNIESIRLTSLSKSGFRLNVDGRTGESFSDIPILGKDSMYVFVEVTVDPTGEKAPVLIEDKIEFMVNGALQTVLLQAHGQDATLISKGFFVTKDTTWSASKPYLIYDSVVVSEGATLTLEKGVLLFMHNNAKWIVEGTLNAAGTLDEPILFRGDRLDRYSDNIPYDRLPGQWDGIYFKAESYGNIMDHVIIRNGNKGLRFYESSPERSKLKLYNSQITNISGDIFYAENCNIEAVNTEFSNATAKVMALFGGEYYFAHCTFVNYMILRPGRNGESVLNLMNYTYSFNGEEASKVSAPLKSATFENCIIDGSFSEGNEVLKGEINIDELNESELNFLFNSCAVKTKTTDDTRFTNVQFISTADTEKHKPEYKSIGDSENGYFYNYCLDISKDKDDVPLKDQVAVGKADITVAEKYPLDRMGISRITSEDGPDIGAYEYVPDPDE